jgi:hypothetical protein
MTTRATGALAIKRWDEKTWGGKRQKDVSGAKLTHVLVKQTLRGDIEGEGFLHPTIRQRLSLA